MKVGDVVAPVTDPNNPLYKAALRTSSQLKNNYYALQNNTPFAEVETHVVKRNGGNTEDKIIYKQVFPTDSLYSGSLFLLSEMNYL